MSGVREQAVEDGDRANGSDPGKDEEARARRAGWVPLEEFRGEAERWKSAQEFLALVDDNFPKAKERNRKLDTKLRRVEQELGSTREALNELRAMAAKSEMRAYERAKAELLAQQQQAVQTGDVATYNQTTAELQRVEADKPKPLPEPVKAPPPEDIAELQAWVRSKPWWDKNQALTTMVTQAHANFMAMNPHLSQMEGLREVEEMLAAKFPDELGKPSTRRSKPVPEDELEEDEPEDRTVSARSRREAPSNVGGSTFTGSASRRSNGKPTKISELPRAEQDDARRAFKKYQTLMPNFTEAEYVSNYLDQ